ncbi:MAG: L-lactate dehydrogenase [Steroidobacteraceae bacterium]|nr:L-lactate dehydrogenase [Steroidobacteraceae bacterium]MBP7015056.1 L-lactate dehydrogenase [Steroidobacteraceae bacterium]
MVGTHDVAPVTPADYRRLAERRLPRFLFDYIDGGANDELTMAANLADFASMKLRQRVMRDVSGVDTSTVLAGRKVAMPVALAPVGMAGMFSRRGEVTGVRAADQAGIPFTLSTLGVCTMQELQAASPSPFWFQLYMMRDRAVVQRLLGRARDAGCDTLLFTVDLAVTGLRHRDVRNGMIGRPTLKVRLSKLRQLLARPGWIRDVGVLGKPHTIGNLSEVVPDPTDLNAYKAWIDEQFDPSVTWKDIEWLRRIWDGKLLIKGVLEAGDARGAVDVGADGVVVSNHGGRQLDGVASSIAKLPGVVAAVGDRVEVLLDGGVRSGVDVLKAVALGARGVLIGRPWVWAAAGAGQQGLIDLLETVHNELRTAMALAGVSRIADVGPELIDA